MIFRLKLTCHPFPRPRHRDIPLLFAMHLIEGRLHAGCIYVRRSGDTMRNLEQTSARSYRWQAGVLEFYGVLSGMQSGRTVLRMLHGSDDPALRGEPMPSAQTQRNIVRAAVGTPLGFFEQPVHVFMQYLEGRDARLSDGSLPYRIAVDCTDVDDTQLQVPVGPHYPFVGDAGTDVINGHDPSKTQVRLLRVPTPPVSSLPASRHDAA